uniref:Uncharacterized protein n=1 Tax=Fagus sylvatica TaxID=28930 RepID=A0A2N9GCN1_FAGSY
MKEIFSTRTVEEDEPLSIADLLNALSTSALVFCRCFSGGDEGVSFSWFHQFKPKVEICYVGGFNWFRARHILQLIV